MTNRQRPHASGAPDEDLAIGEKVSSDVKILPAPTFHRERYIINIVDHRSRFGICYLMKTKTEVHHRLRQYAEDMRAWESKIKMYKLTAAANISSKKVSRVAPNAVFTLLVSRNGN